MPRAFINEKCEFCTAFLSPDKDGLCVASSCPLEKEVPEETKDDLLRDAMYQLVQYDADAERGRKYHCIYCGFVGKDALTFQHDNKCLFNRIERKLKED